MLPEKAERAACDMGQSAKDLRSPRKACHGRVRFETRAFGITVLGGIPIEVVPARSEKLVSCQVVASFDLIRSEVRFLFERNVFGLSISKSTFRR